MSHFVAFSLGCFNSDRLLEPVHANRHLLCPGRESRITEARFGCGEHPLIEPAQFRSTCRREVLPVETTAREVRKTACRPHPDEPDSGERNAPCGVRRVVRSTDRPVQAGEHTHPTPSGRHRCRRTRGPHAPGGSRVACMADDRRQRRSVRGPLPCPRAEAWCTADHERIVRLDFRTNGMDPVTATRNPARKQGLDPVVHPGTNGQDPGEHDGEKCRHHKEIAHPFSVRRVPARLHSPRQTRCDVHGIHPVLPHPRGLQQHETGPVFSS